MTRPPSFNEDEARHFWQWARLDNAEVNYIGQPGSGRVPRVFYATDEDAFIYVCRRCPKEMMLAVGVNPRPLRVRTFATNLDIETVQNFYLDVEVSRKRAWGDNGTPEEHEAAEAFVKNHLLPWFVCKGFVRPKVSKSGGFYHLHLSVKPIDVKEHPDVNERLVMFYDEVRGDLASHLDPGGLKIDRTGDLRRLVKVPGSAKPSGGLQSSFDPDPTRIDDDILRAHVLSLACRAAGVKHEPVTVTGDFDRARIPQTFWDALETDSRLKLTWERRRTDLEDTSRSGHDFALLGKAVHLGISDPEALAALLFHVPYNEDKWTEKGPRETKRYIEHQVKKVLEREPPSGSVVIGPAATTSKANHVIIGEIDYEVHNSEKTRDGIRATITARRTGSAGVCKSKVPLWSGTSRRRFAKDAVAKLGGEVDVIERGLTELETALLVEEEARAKPTASSSTTPASTAAAEADAMAMLVHEDLIERIADDLTAMGTVGEDEAKVLVYLVCTSRLMADPLAVLLQGRSAAGKSEKADKAIELMPADQVVDATSFSQHALEYAGPDLLRHKVVRVAEHVETEENKNVYYQLRELLSRKAVSRAVATKNERTGKVDLKMQETAGPIAYIETTTRTRINEENATRMFTLRVDESATQTRRIHKCQKAAHTSFGILRNQKRQRVIERHHALQRLLRRLPVMIKWADRIEFPSDVLRTRRDLPRFLSLIEVIAFLHQFQRPKESVVGVDYIVASASDYEMARDLAAVVLEDSLSDVAPAATTLLDGIKEAQSSGKLHDIFTKRSIKEALGPDANETFVYRGLEELQKHDLVEKVSDGRGKYGGTFKVAEGGVRPRSRLKSYGTLLLSEPRFNRLRRGGGLKSEPPDPAGSRPTVIEHDDDEPASGSADGE